MHRRCVNNFVPEIKALVARKDQKLNVVFPKMSQNRIYNVEVPKMLENSESNLAVIPAISTNCKNGAEIPMTPPNSKNNLGAEIRTSNNKNSVLLLMTTSNCENSVEKEKINQNYIFRSILFIAFIVGMPVSPAMLFAKRSRLVDCLKIWNRSVFYIRTIFLVIPCLYNYMFWTSVTQRYSTQASILIGYGTMLVFYMKRKEIETALVKMTHLSSELNSHGAKPLIRCYEFACFFLCISFYILALYFFYFTYWGILLEKVRSDVPLPNSYSHWYCSIVIFAEASTYHVGSATLFLSTLLSSRSYLLSGEFLRLFSEKLKKDVSRGRCQGVSLSQNLNLFSRIFSCAEAVDDAFCIIAFLIYMDVINNYYLVMGTLLSREEKQATADALLLVFQIGLGATLKFFYLTLSGDFLSRRHECLSSDLLEISNYALRKSSILGVDRFIIALANIRTVDMHVTGMGYFKITRLIIPSAISVLISYGVTIYQLGATKTEN